MNRDHYRVLGVSPGASHKDVRTAYLRLVKQHHPDVNKSCGDGSQFKAISSAWAVLGDKSKRALYDEKLGDIAFRPTGRDRAGTGLNTRPRNWKSRAGGRGNMPPILRMFESATHPKTLLWVIPLAVAGFFVFGGKEDDAKEKATIRKVRAWHNPVTNRWETPAPWDPHFRKHEHLVQKVDRDLVHQTERRR